MIPKVIKTEKEYDKALARINDLMDAEPSTPEGDELGVLVTMVEMYEKTKYPIDPPDPEIDRIWTQRRANHLQS
ncbi:MAG: transcriptional regulator [Deltaproteobacteria bacterium]|nr:transcriptional regulator [Deltaproteobacteria bacterium]